MSCDQLTISEEPVRFPKFKNIIKYPVGSGSTLTLSCTVLSERKVGQDSSTQGESEGEGDDSHTCEFKGCRQKLQEWELEANQGFWDGGGGGILRA